MSEGLFLYLWKVFPSLLFVFARISVFFIAFPFVSSPFLPVRIRVFLSLALSFYLVSFVHVSGITLDSVGLLEFFLIVLREVLIGLSFALVAQIFFAIVIYAADVLSYLMGLTVVNLFDPTFGMVSVVGRFFVFLFYLLFFETDAYKVFLAALVESFRLIPPGGFSISQSIFDFFLRETSLIFSFGFKMAFPFLFVLFVANLILALVNRLIPQINVFIVGLPMQIFVGLLFLSLGFSAVIYFMVELLNRYGEDLVELLKVFGAGGG